ncbi:hypothetical protein MPTK1_4g23040 [Marchantia polymorpha subsp. ruderalis]|uniref:F-box domain-containing protein n=2 Tax=Marchantia polymorpha TaxID=3197 RepID=A0AAF6BCU7_MARPO|nr:hypothetical protein MARPO_0020s0066 [Marchantia polymorpha]BBN09831.1 hypothetical protein Mp_4g23040 [Marchantia polymorpha subsp. ruderalis]|eukprot:PTQ44406.1 hypothetical protein MARPO_0020s0066 [Marchantia polymorpha]
MNIDGRCAGFRAGEEESLALARLGSSGGFVRPQASAKFSMETEVNSLFQDNCVTDDMDPTLWSRLPQDLLERVVAKLPTGSSMKMRCVCREWNAMICGRDICPPCLNDSLLLCTYVGLPYHLVLKWVNPRTASWNIRLLSLYKFRGGDYPGHNLLTARGALVACDGGVLCFGFPYNVQHIVLCNPLTKCWRKLPGLIFHKAAYTWRVAGMSFNKEAGHHVIVMAGFFSEERERGANRLKATQIYDSSTDSWSFAHQPTPVRGGIWSTSVNKVVFTEDYLFVLTSASLGSQHFLQIFSMKKRTWVEISVEGAVDNNGSAYLITQQGEIYLVAQEQRHGIQHLTFWKLDTSNIEDLWRQSFKRRVFGANVRILWHRVSSIAFSELAAMTDLPFQWDVWGCVVHRRKICFMFPSINCQAEVYDIFIEHDMEAGAWQMMKVNKPTTNRHLCSFEPSYANIFPTVSDSFQLSTLSID